VSGQPPLTTEALLDTAEERMGLTRQQLLILVAKSATVRHLATNPDCKDLFVLKGGTLLSNVYRSPRQSIADADYTYLEPAQLTIPRLDAAFAINGEYGFYLNADWSFDRELFEGKHRFSIEGITLSSRPRSRELKVTVSVRAGEWLDRDKDNPPLIYHDSLLASDATFAVNGLTRNELAAEKLLGWCSKPLLAKHFVDLAYLAREHAEHVDHEKVAGLVREKFSKEKGAERYRKLGIRTTADVVAGFADPAKLAGMRRDWKRFSETELLLLPHELSQPADTTLSEAANVERQATEFWEPTLVLLR
jgi:Nucleotidyl transferase AbiEii toxin, Type IV TA system